MSIMMCPKHGRQPGERVSQRLIEKHRSGVNISTEIKDLPLRFLDYECRFFGLTEDAINLGRPDEDGDIWAKTDDDLNVKLKNIKIMCLHCLIESANLHKIPFRE